MSPDNQAHHRLISQPHAKSAAVLCLLPPFNSPAAVKAQASLVLESFSAVAVTPGIVGLSALHHLLCRLLAIGVVTHEVVLRAEQISLSCFASSSNGPPFPTGGIA